MHKIVTPLILCFILTQSYAQTERKISTYLLVQYNKTLYDYTRANNPWGAGLGLQTFFNNNTKFKPTLELTGDFYSDYNKISWIDAESVPKEDIDVHQMINLFVGSSFHPTQNIYLSFVAGPSFISGKTLLGIKPSFGFYFSKTQRLTGKISYINVFNRTKIVTNEDFGSLNLAVGIKLF